MQRRQAAAQAKLRKMHEQLKSDQHWNQAQGHRNEGQDTKKGGGRLRESGTVLDDAQQHPVSEARDGKQSSQGDSKRRKTKEGGTTEANHANHAPNSRWLSGVAADAEGGGGITSSPYSKAVPDP